jgi:putative transcriptional regulator
MTDNSRGKILIATTKMTDYVFQNSVIYVHTDDDTGSIGVILNISMEPTMAMKFAEDINWPHPTEIHLGGPVEPQLGYVIHTNDYARETSIMLNDALCYTGGRHIVDDIHRSVGPYEFVLMTGYCQWAPHQLTEEVYNGLWIETEFDIDYFFNNLGREEGWEFAVHIASENKTNNLLNMFDKSS